MLKLAIRTIEYNLRCLLPFAWIAFLCTTIAHQGFVSPLASFSRSLAGPAFDSFSGPNAKFVMHRLLNGRYAADFGIRIKLDF
jgi:hypothetical protein